MIRCIFSVLSREMSFGVVRDQLHFSVLTKKTSFEVICDQVACFSIKREGGALFAVHLRF